MQNPGEALTVSCTLAKLSAHLDKLAGDIFSVEEALGKLLENEQSARGISITKFQSLDFARQSLEDCALLLHVLGKIPATQTPLDDPGDLGRKLKLDATKSLLARSDSRPSITESGELDLF